MTLPEFAILINNFENPIDFLLYLYYYNIQRLRKTLNTNERGY